MQPSSSGDDYSGLPGSGLTADYKDAGVPDISGMFDNCLWDDVSGHREGEIYKPTPEEQRQIDISAGFNGNGSTIDFI